ncbi:MAG: TonB family protein, partial [Pseudomonadota bacterium]
RCVQSALPPPTSEKRTSEKTNNGGNDGGDGVGFDRDGDEFFMVMEWLDGEPLTELLQRHRSSPLSRTVALRMLRSIARGLAHAHQSGVAHADVKPANIYITRDRQVKVLDFGLARAVNENNTEETEVTGFTPAYASCEVLEGALPTPQDDVYALGCIAYRLLTGNHPFGNLRATEAESQELVPAPIQGLPMGVWESIEHSLAFRRDDRIPDAAVFLDYLNPRQQRSPKKGAGGRKTGTVALVGLLALVAAAGVGFYLYSQSEQPEVRSLEAEAQPTAETLNEQARQALDAGRITEPELDNALYYYTKALELNPNDPVAATGIDLITQSTSSALETALANFDLNEAVRSLGVLTELQPENPLIATATDQLNSIAASNLQTALATQLEQELPVAQDLVVQAALILGDDSPSVVAVREDLANRFSVEAKLEKLMQGLNASLASDLLLEGDGTQESAKSFVDQLRTIDPLAPDVVQGSERYVSALVFQTMLSSSARDFDRADNLVAEAKRLGLQSDAVNRAEQEVIRAKTQAAQDAQELADAKRIAQEAAEAAAAEAAAAEAAALEQEVLAQQEADAAAAEGAIDGVDVTTGIDTTEGALTVDGGESDSGVGDNPQVLEAQATSDQQTGDLSGETLALDAQALQSAIEPIDDAGEATDVQLVPLSALQFKRYVQPRLVPTSATRRQQEGFIDVQFTVNQDGTTSDIQVTETTMSRRSITRAVNAVERWRFEAIPQPVRSGVRLRYEEDAG